MKTRTLLPWLLTSILGTTAVLAQPVPAAQRPAGNLVPGNLAPAAEREPPGAQGALPSTMDAIARATDVPFRAKPAGHLVKFNLQEADLAELVNHISGLTGKRFIYGAKVRQIKATVVSPEPVTLAEAYEAFLSILEANGMTVIPHGRFLKIVDSGGVVNQTTPIVARGEPVPVSDRYITRLYRMQNVGADEAANLLGKFKSKEADVSVYSPGNLLILTDTGTNIDRMIRILEEIDVGGAGQSMWIEPVHYGSANEMAQRINEVFGLNAAPGAAGAPGGAGGASAGGLSKVVADQQSNSLIILGTEDSYTKLLEVLKRLDAQPGDSGRIRVLPLQHAKAEELAAVLNQMLQGAKSGGSAASAAQPGAAASKDLFEGEVRVTADKATNSLLITSLGRDYATMRLVVTQLDKVRRQVFIEAVIMDLDVSDTQKLGTSWHMGDQEDLGGGNKSLIAGGLKAQNSLPFPQNQDMLQGFAVGVRGPALDGTQNLLGTGLSIPAFGVVVNALTTSGTTNVLATPHIIATDNIPAEITIGQNIPLQENIGGGLSGLAGLAGAGAAPGAAGAAGGLGALGMLGGMGMGGGFSAPRQDVGIKIKVTPHINDSSQVQLELQQESSDRGASSGNIGAVTIIKRTANTTVTVEDQQTVVIGGLMREQLVKSDEKIPLLGDIPVLGFLFRHSKTEKRKANLLLILTPYVVRDQTDLRKIFERKMQERQEFLDRYFVFTGNDWSPPRDYSRANGVVEDIRQAYFRLEEQERLLRESEPTKRAHAGTAPIALPEVPTSSSAHTTGAQPAAAAPAGAGAPLVPQNRTPVATPPAGAAPTPVPATPQPFRTRRRAPQQGALEAPVVVQPMARSVNVERAE